MTGRRIELVALALALAAGCGGEAGIRVRLDLDATDCGRPAAQITLPCEGVVGVWLLDDKAQVIEETCTDLIPGLPLFVLDDLLLSQGVRFPARAPGERVSVEVAVFEQGVPGCPREEATFDPGQSFVYGRSDQFVVDEGVEPQVTLVCHDVANQCDPAFTISASLMDLETLSLFATSESITAGVVVDAQFQPLAELISDGNGDTYAGQLAELPEGDCFGAAVTIDAVPGLSPLLSCDGSINEGTNRGSIEAHYLSPALRQTFADLLPPMTTFVVGRVIDPVGLPTENATIEAGGVFVGYPDESFDRVLTGRTASHGFFVMHGPSSECCYDVTATLDEAPTLLGQQRTGTVVGHTVTTTIQLEPR